MALSDHRVLSLPHRVHFCGWVATLPALQQAGWELSAEQDFHRYGVRIAMRHRDLQLRGITNTIEFDFYDRSPFRDRPLDFSIAYMASALHVVTNDNVSAFSPIDAMPQFISTERKSIDDFGIFATPLARTEEIIVDPHDVMALLDRIKDLQRPEQAAIRERNRSRERRLDEPGQRTQFHAQILSIAA
ncbi:hypothetical protein [Paraburkholderia pallida]|uniref:Uncharacterized protein n=1 Tax=Paraburkholderia pallida TaxID=2547399 RepID=A0A4P7CY36_9BURK|nr:hypothetical protein [Paraburkholderia pallida]QBQ99239.1 hypothetical protein E1956_18720 [Paraburkholderia pallida]